MAFSPGKKSSMNRASPLSGPKTQKIQYGDSVSNSRSLVNASPMSGAERTRGAPSPYIRRVRENRARKADGKRGKSSGSRSRSPLKETQIAKPASDRIPLAKEYIPDADRPVTCNPSDAHQGSKLASNSQDASCAGTNMVTSRASFLTMRSPHVRLLASPTDERSANPAPTSCSTSTELQSAPGSSRIASCAVAQASFDFQSKFEHLLNLRMTDPERELTSVQEKFEEHIHASQNLTTALRSELTQSRAELSTKNEKCLDLQQSLSRSEDSCADLQSQNTQLNATLTTLQSQLDEMKQMLAQEKEARESAEMAVQNGLEAVRKVEESARLQLDSMSAQMEEERAKVQAHNDEEVHTWQHIINCYARMTGFTIQLDASGWDEKTEAFRCFFSDAVGMDGHGFSLKHHLDCGEMEYSPEVQSVTATPRKTKRRRSVGRSKITSLPEYLREEIFFDDCRGSPRFTFLMLQALTEPMKETSA